MFGWRVDMATTFKISNGDVVLSQVTGRPELIGNAIEEGIIAKDNGAARSKLRQDLARSLSLERVRAGTTANIQSIIGIVPQFGAQTVSLLVNRQIRDMVSAIIREQSKRPNVRPPSEKIRSISKLQVFPDNRTDASTAFRFRLGIRTQDARGFDLTGSF